jgi:prolyl oligopeptidase
MPAASRYPAAPRLDLTEDLHGRLVADPYRWLEDHGDPRTAAWCTAQDELFARSRADWLGRPAAEALRRHLTALADAGHESVPAWRGQRRFFTRRRPGQEHPVLLTAGPDGAERVLIDPAALDPSGATTLDDWFPSREGGRLAYLLSAGGTEQSVLRVLDVATGQIIDGPIDRAAHSTVTWLPGGATFYYRRQPAAGAAAKPFHRPVYLHRVGTDPGRDVLILGPGLPEGAYFSPQVSADGRWLRMDADWGSVRVDTYLADLAADGIEAPRFTAVQEGIDAVSALTFGRDGRLYVLTDRAAPNRRLCVTDPGRPGYQHWRTLLAEDPEAVLGGFVILDSVRRPFLLALRTRHAISELTLHDLATGAVAATVPVPGQGTVSALTGHPDGGPRAWFTYTDHRTPPAVWCFDADSGQVTQWAPSPGGHGPVSGVHVRQVVCQSADGTPVRMFILAPVPEPDRPRPAILYGYGSFGHSQFPAYRPLRLAWVQAGGVYAIACGRGGGEEGRAWHLAGLGADAQRSVDDLHAAGDYLVARGWTSRSRLGLHGGSAGGRLVGMALVQRPGACAAVLCSAPVLDLVRCHLGGLGALWAAEYGSADDPEQFGWLLAQSPYHHVRPGTAYPAVLLTVSEGDTRVSPMHARKLAAALQHATTAPAAARPVLLRREPNAGHLVQAGSRSVPLWLDQLSFFARQLGLAPGDDC